MEWKNDFLFADLLYPKQTSNDVFKVGFLIGIGLSWLLAEGLSSELYRLPLVFSAYNFLFAFTVIIIVSALSGILVRRRLVTLDLVEVLKTRE